MEMIRLKGLYRSFGIKARLILMTALGIISLCVAVLQSSSDLQDLLEQKTQERQVAQEKWKKSEVKSQQLPGLEKKLQGLLSELDKIKRFIPENFAIDQLLQKTAEDAAEAAVILQSFSPGKILPATQLLRYVSIQIHISLLGNYNNLVTFIDTVVHWPITVHIQNFHLSLSEITPDGTDVIHDSYQKKKSKVSKISAKMDMVLYRSLSKSEEIALQSASEPVTKLDQKNKKKNTSK